MKLVANLSRADLGNNFDSFSGKSALLFLNNSHDQLFHYGNALAAVTKIYSYAYQEVGHRYASS